MRLAILRLNTLQEVGVIDVDDTTGRVTVVSRMTASER